MKTNEERREIAARLRNYENLRESFRESPICAFLDALGVEYLDWKGVCKRIADLIEPAPERTCKLAKVHDWDDELEPFGYECESCGEGLPRCYGSDKFGMVTTPNYCPNCGAKVISGDA